MSLSRVIAGHTSPVSAVAVSRYANIPTKGLARLLAAYQAR